MHDNIIRVVEAMPLVICGKRLILRAVHTHARNAAGIMLTRDYTAAVVKGVAVAAVGVLFYYDLPLRFVPRIEGVSGDVTENERLLFPAPYGAFKKLAAVNYFDKLLPAVNQRAEFRIVSLQFKHFFSLP